MKPNQQPWIEEGYTQFALEGPHSLKVEPLAQAVGKNKSSFYHHFADLEVFTEYLLKHHLAQAEILAKKEATAQNLEELITHLLEHKMDLLFNRQLRFHRDHPAFADTCQKVGNITTPAFIGLWAKIIGLEDNSYLAGLVLQLSIENFFLQINEDTLHQAWLRDYFKQQQRLVQAFKQAGNVAALNGSV